jgi:hypothetical protein
VFVLDVLKHFDLPQVAAAIAGRNLAILAPVDAMKRPADIGVARKIYQAAEETFGRLGGGFRLLAQTPDADPADQYLALFRA